MQTLQQVIDSPSPVERTKVLERGREIIARVNQPAEQPSTIPPDRRQSR